MNAVIRDVAGTDLEAILTLNQDARPAVSDLTQDELATFAEMATYFRVADQDGRILGFLIGLEPHATYSSMNFQWFRRHYDSFVYVDRIVIHEDARGMGLGRRFYADIEQFARQRAPILTCEVNTRPRNEESLQFHETLGFAPVGMQDTEGRKKTVVMLSKPVTDSP